jgi:hypothetical protein
MIGSGISKQNLLIAFKQIEVGSGIRCFFTPQMRNPGWSNGRIRKIRLKNELFREKKLGKKVASRSVDIQNSYTFHLIQYRRLIICSFLCFLILPKQFRCTICQYLDLLWMRSLYHDLKRTNFGHLSFCQERPTSRGPHLLPCRRRFRLLPYSACHSLLSPVWPSSWNRSLFFMEGEVDFCIFGFAISYNYLPLIWIGKELLSPE